MIHTRSAQAQVLLVTALMGWTTALLAQGNQNLATARGYVYTKQYAKAYEALKAYLVQTPRSLEAHYLVAVSACHVPQLQIWGLEHLVAVQRDYAVVLRRADPGGLVMTDQIAQCRTGEFMDPIPLLVAQEVPEPGIIASPGIAGSGGVLIEPNNKRGGGGPTSFSKGVLAPEKN